MNLFVPSSFYFFHPYFVKKIAYSLQHQITQNFHYNKCKIVFSTQHDFIQVDLLQILLFFVIF